MKDFILALIPNFSALIQAGLLVLGAFSALLGALGGLFALIPGEQPEKFLFAFAEKVANISRKAPEEKKPE